ncbi:hypothetical protein ABPG73_012424 [Tetrahymena malaccensis]
MIQKGEFKRQILFKTVFYLLLLDISTGIYYKIYNLDQLQNAVSHLNCKFNNQYNGCTQRSCSVDANTSTAGICMKAGYFPMFIGISVNLLMRIEQNFGDNKVVIYDQCIGGQPLYSIGFQDDIPQTCSVDGIYYQSPLNSEQGKRLQQPINSFSIMITKQKPVKSQISEINFDIIPYCQIGCYLCIDIKDCQPSGCLEGYTHVVGSYNGYSKFCVKNCAKGEFGKLSINPFQYYLDSTCTACTTIQNCIICKYDNTCIQCKTGYIYDNKAGYCVPGCPQGCSGCDLITKNCTQCESGYTKMTNPNDNTLYYCQKNCSAGQYSYVTNTTTMDQECRFCILNCQNCTGPNNCSNCLSGYAYISQDNQCTKCTEGCSDCDSNLSCNQCISGYTKTINPQNNSQQYCKKICSAGQYVQIKNQQTMEQYMDIMIYVTFFIQICDQSGPQYISEPLNIEISSKCVPQLNQNLTEFKYNQTEILVKKYTIPSQAIFDLTSK